MRRVLLSVLLSFLPVIAYALGEQCHGSFQSGSLACNNPCNEGCTLGTTMLPSGELAVICVCDIVGPQPNCCRLGVLASGALVKTGSCLAPGCSTSGLCRLIQKRDLETGQLIYTTTMCDPTSTGQ